MNSVQFIGRLTSDPEVRYTPAGNATATFNIAIDRPPKKDGTHETDFPRITCWGTTAELCERYLTKGRLVAVSAHVRTGSYTNRDGQKVYTTDFIADRVEFLDKPQDRQQETQQDFGGLF